MLAIPQLAGARLRWSAYYLTILATLTVSAFAGTYSVTRFDEDPASHADATAQEGLDALKYIALNDSGDIYFGLGGQVRVRWENWDNFGFAPANDDDFFLTRLLLHADFRFKDSVRVFVEGKSALSTARDLPGGRRALDEDALDLQNAFIDLSVPVGDNELTVRSGRQELKYGKQRLISPLDWSNTRRTFDGFRGLFDAGDWQVDAFWTRLVRVEQHELNDNNSGSDFYGIYANHVLPDHSMNYDTYLLVLDRDTGAFDAGVADEERYTMGFRLGGALVDTPYDYDVEAAYQFGDHGSDDIDAYFFASQLGRKTELPMSPRFYVGYDYASGDSDPMDGDLGTFNQLFPLGHAYHGYIDVVGRQNISDLSAGVAMKPADKVTAKLDGHLFWRAENEDALYNAGGGIVRAGDTSSESEVGQEIDLTLKYAFDQHLLAVVGYSHFFAGDFIEDSGPDSDIDFVYTTLQYTF